MGKLLRRLPVFRARALRVFVEVLCLQSVITLAWPFIAHLLEQTALRHVFSSNTGKLDAATIAFYREAILYIFYCIAYPSLSALWTAFRWRLRPQTRSFWLHALLELALPLAFFCECILSVRLWQWVTGGSSLFTILHFPNRNLPLNAQLHVSTMTPYIITAICSGVVLALRTGIYLLRFWNHLRRTHLRWALTHAHLMIVVIGAGTICLLLIGIQLPRFLANFIQSNFSFQAFFTPFLFGLLFLSLALLLTGIGVAIVLPPSALFSYLFARHMTRRIEKLAVATAALRRGNYDVRVAVEGRDEIARLQTDFNAMAAELERAMRELQEERDTVTTLLQARRELIASVSHELRTPVATVRSYLESTLAGWNEQPPATLRQDMQVMEQQTIRLQSLINDLFTLARAEVGQLEMHCTPTNVTLLAQRVAETMAPLAWRGSRIEIIADLAKAESDIPSVLVDENRLEQIVQNLLHNAIRHTPPGGIIVVGVDVDAQAVLLQVKDTGEGIATEELERIWERFYRAENTRNKPGSGSGLGLAIVKELTEAMGGTVTVVSELGQGTCFTLRLPRVQSPIPDATLEKMHL